MNAFVWTQYHSGTDGQTHRRTKSRDVPISSASMLMRDKNRRTRPTACILRMFTLRAKLRSVLQSPLSVCVFVCLWVRYSQRAAFASPLSAFSSLCESRVVVRSVGCSSAAYNIDWSIWPGSHPERQLAGLSLLQQERQTRRQGPSYQLVLIMR